MILAIKEGVVIAHKIQRVNTQGMSCGADHSLSDKFLLDCPSARDLRYAAARLARLLDPHAILSLDGPLGAGKTEFVKGLAEGLGCRDQPTSPTFAIAHEYTYPGGLLCHFDFYRMDSEAELETSGFYECRGEALTVVEWGGKFASALPETTLRLRLSYRDDSRAIFHVSGPLPAWP